MSAPTEAGAREIALACDTEVVVEPLTDPWSSTTILPDGYAKLSSAIDAVRAPDPDDADGDGTPWRPVDSTLRGAPVGGRIVMAAPAADLTFSAGDTGGSGSGGPLASLTTPEGHTVTVNVPFDLPAPVVDVAAGQVVYPLAAGVDVIVTPNSDGTSFSEVIRADSADALSSVPELGSLTGDGLVFPVTVSDGLDLRSADAGGFEVTETATARVVAVLPAARAWDSAADAVLAPAPQEALSEPSAESSTESAALTAEAGSEVLVAPDGELIGADGVDERRAEAPVAGDAVESLNAELVTGAQAPAGADAGVVISLDADVLAGMDGVIHIDPTTGTKNPGGKAVIQSAYPSSVHYNDATSFPMGACTATIGCPTTNVVRSAFQWTGLTSIASLRGSDIREATFRIFGSHTYACSSRVTQLYRTAAISSSTTWSNFSPSSKWQSKVDEKDIHHKPTCNNDRDIEWNIGTVAKWAADNNSARITLGLKGTSTSDVYTWKRYENPRLEIVYNRAPLVPKSGEMKLDQEGSQPEPCSTTSSGAPSFPMTSGIVMRGVARDPDSRQVRVKFRVLTAGGTQVYYTADWSATQAPPATFERSIPSSALSGGGTFKWQMAVQDVLDGSGDRNTTWDQSPNCYFTVDVTNPGSPSITSSQYPEGKISGGVGVTGSFTLDSPSSDVVTYKYSMNSDGLGSSKAPSSPGGPVTIPFSMTRPGSHLLYAQAVDDAGRTAERTYRFTVDYPTTAAYWHMDQFTSISGSTDVNTADAGGLRHTLRLSEGVGRSAPGPFALNLRRPEDKALVFDGSASDTAFTAGPVVNTFGCASDTTGPAGVRDGRTEDLGHKAAQCANQTGEYDFRAGFTVSAFVRADEVGDLTKVAVSQDAVKHVGFNLGKLASTHCPANAAGVKPVTCWGFWTYDEDGGESAGQRVYSTRPVVAGEWVHLAGVFNATGDELSLSVCPVPVDPDNRDPEGTGIPVTDPGHGATDYTGKAWSAGGPVQLGRSQFNDVRTYGFKGAIDEVRLYNAPLGNGQITAICTGDMTGGAELEDGDGDGAVVGDPGDIPPGGGE
ncbi:LamG domain-containing protein [Promicromonospora panici]|uniref:LamG domain-containing protein n=1 Tax=Promicromonospora panici TaxID=2219658 RepID=UPI00101CF81F|nr:LamG domain-containing protein [Promicromonospora panici]